MMSTPQQLNSQLSSAKIQLLYSGDEYFLHILEQIEKAKTSIRIESYIFDLDPIGLKILLALEQACQRGVQVRILVDGVGSYNWIYRLRQTCKQKKIHLRVYHPLPLVGDFWRHISWKNLNRLLILFRRLNKRNHRKVVLIDERLVLMGSFNISQVHSETYMDKSAWRDSGLMAYDFSDPVEIQSLRNAFEEAWRTAKYFSGSHLRSFLRRKWKKATAPHSRFRLNNRPLWRHRLLRDLNFRIKNAQNKICITNAYFLPRKSVLRNLRDAARRGVAVSILLPEKTDVWFVREASRSLYRRLLLSGVHIYEYTERILHAKTLMIDEWAIVGSHNFNHRSFIHDLEVDAVMNEPEHLSSLRAQWDKDLQASRKVTLQEINNTFLLRLMVSRMLYWFRFWL